VNAMTHHERLTATTADLRQLNADELEAVAYLIQKLIAGGKKHGPLALATDARDWPSEMMEEYADALFYAAFASVQRARRTAPLADLAGLAARESAPVEAARQRFLDPDPDITSDSWFQCHPLGSPERVQAVEEHRAACAGTAAVATAEPMRGTP
jgi:hypothetical protein